MPRSRFVEGPAGVGKTTHAIEYVRTLLEQGAAPESILILVPHPALALTYQDAFAAPDWPQGAQVNVTTLSALAEDGLQTFWPWVAQAAGFADPVLEPTFLNIETAQYHMAQFVREDVREGVFDSVSLSPFKIMRQTLNNLTRASVYGFTLNEVADRLITAWGNRHSSRPLVYRASVELARRFREHCLRHSLLDYSLQMEVFTRHLLQEPMYKNYFSERYHHLVADNLEESQAIVVDFVRWAWDSLESALLLFDTDGGYRSILGADPYRTHMLAELCDEHETWTEPVGAPPAMLALAQTLAASVSVTTPGFAYVPEDAAQPALEAVPPEVFYVSVHSFYPQMVEWTVEQIAALLERGAEPREIVVLAPFLTDALRFSLTARLEERGIPVVSHRPSRAIKDEPVARAVLTLMELAHPEWQAFPPAEDVGDALQLSIAALDPVRAWLLAQVVYHPGQVDLGTFGAIKDDMQQRITAPIGAQYERLRRWLDEYRYGDERQAPDQFLSRLFGEVLSQPGFGLHEDLEAGRVVAELVQSARNFRQALYADSEAVDNWSDVSKEYVQLVREGLLAALYVSSWADEQRNAVFLSSASTFLMRNRWVDYQFWLDVGSDYWWDRLEQPLTNPYVLMRDYPPDQVWTDEIEYATREDVLRRLVLGLARRCRKRLYLAVSTLSEQGYEQRGPLLRIVQHVLRRADGEDMDPEEADV